MSVAVVGGRLVGRTIGPLAVLVVLGIFLAPWLNQPSTWQGRPVIEIAAARLGPSLSLAVVSIILATIVWGLFASLSRFAVGWAAPLAAVSSLMLLCLTPLWTGLLGILVFGVVLRVLPIAGYGSPAHFVLPGATLAIMLISLLARTSYLRAAARAAGAPATTQGAVRELVGDAVETLRSQAGTLIGTQVIVEGLVAWPGIGLLFLQARERGDTPLVAVAVLGLVALTAGLTALLGLAPGPRRSWIDREDGQRTSEAQTAESSRAHVRLSSSRVHRRPELIGFLLGLLLIVALAIFASSPQADPLAQSETERRQPPGAVHLLGTDALGRDFAAHLAAATGMALVLTVTATALAALIGVPLGLVSVARGPRVNAIISGLVDAGLTVPSLVIVLAAMWTFGRNHPFLIAVFGLAMAPVLARLTRDALRATWSCGQPHSGAARGAIALAILVGMAQTVLLEAITSSVAGAPFAAPSLGALVGSGRQYVTLASWLVVLPIVVLTALVAGFTLLGYSAFGLLRPRRTAQLTTR